ncbi:carbohydrate-binding module family 50 protein [Xylaria nigripes]|nr:carbohydrate-binding module family 50 protein [Xylaria nigripes]
MTSECSKALLIDVTACDPLVKNLRADFFYPPKSLSRICVDDCSSALATWVSSVRTSCGNQTVPGDLEMEAAAVYFPGSLEYAFQFSCLQDASGRYCGPVAALAAAFSDPGINPFNYISNTTGQDKPDNCDLCLAERLRLRAGSPYFDGPIVASESLYESMTSSCTITGRPISKTTVDYFTSTPTPTASTCDGSKYTVQASDDCYSISRDQGIGTAWLLADNHLDAYCANFPGEGTELCMANKCATVTVGVNATCADIAGTANITESQLHAWNPIINYACTNLASMNGTEVCVDAPGRKFVTPTDTSALPPMTPTVPATIPTNAADGSDKPCGRWYSVQEGDYCNLLTLKFGISLNDLIFLNPALNVNCTNLLADESYCVQAVGDINTYSGRPGQMTLTIDPNATFTGVPFTQLPDATDTGYKRLYTPLPTATGTRDDCVEYFPGDDYQLNVTGTNFANPCLIAVAVYNVDLDSFASWNAGLNLSSPSCAFETGVRYCGSWYLQPPDKLDPTPTSSSGPPGPTMSGQPADCNKWAVVEDGVTCSDLAAAAGISLDQFLAWNPTVSSDCSTNYWIGNAYCVGVSSSSSTSPTTSPPTATSQGPPGPTMSGEPDNCNKWTVVTDGLTCTELADDAGISLDQFLAWNPAVSSDCLTNYWLGEAYCIGVADTMSSSE